MKKWGLILAFIFSFVLFDVQATDDTGDTDGYIVSIVTTYNKVLEFKVDEFHIKRNKLTVVNSFDYEYPIRNTIYHDEILSVSIEPIDGTIEDEKEFNHYLKKLTKKGYEVLVETDATLIASDKQ